MTSSQNQQRHPHIFAGAGIGISFGIWLCRYGLQWLLLYSQLPLWYNGLITCTKPFTIWKHYLLQQWLQQWACQTVINRSICMYMKKKVSLQAFWYRSMDLITILWLTTHFWLTPVVHVMLDCLRAMAIVAIIDKTSPVVLANDREEVEIRGLGETFLQESNNTYRWYQWTLSKNLICCVQPLAVITTTLKSQQPFVLFLFHVHILRFGVCIAQSTFCFMHFY